jgi:hypothetical protein
VKKQTNQEELTELVCQAFETEKGGIEVFRTALRCAVDPELREKWQEYLEQAQKHKRILLKVFERFDLDPNAGPPGRSVLQDTADLLVAAMETVLEIGKPEEAQIVAAECVMETRTKSHLNWDMIGEAGKSIKGKPGEVLREAHELMEEEKDRRFYHTVGRTGILGSIF